MSKLLKQLERRSISGSESAYFSSIMSKYLIWQKEELKIANRIEKSLFLYINLNLITFVCTKILIYLKNCLRELKSKSSHISAVQSSYILSWRKSNYCFQNSWYLSIPVINCFRLNLGATLFTPTADFHFSGIIFESKNESKSV